ncbi:hypothetical protein VPHK389_0090 [Vibrio phage K389]|nr:hypothetical protein SIPHO010v1_p0014 [Vibrio phage 268E42.1]
MGDKKKCSNCGLSLDFHMMRSNELLRGAYGLSQDEFCYMCPNCRAYSSHHAEQHHMDDYDL